MRALSYILALALLLGLTGCVQARINAYYHPKPKEPCEVPIYVDGRYVKCVSKTHAKEILRDLTR